MRGRGVKGAGGSIWRGGAYGASALTSRSAPLSASMPPLLRPAAWEFADTAAESLPWCTLTAVRPFRFGVAGGRQTRADWLDLAQAAEDLGYATLLLPDHFGPQLAPLPALLAAALATRTLRVGTIVLDNDFRHPALLAKEAATVDLLTDGRFELGIGAGWMASDYTRSGLPFDPPAERVSRLAEAVRIIRAFFAAEGPLTFQGRYSRIDGLEPAPRPAQARLPILIGASRPRMLRLAAHEADIVGLEDHQFAERLTGAPRIHVADCAEQVGVVRAAAGPRMADLELSVFAARTFVTDAADDTTQRLADELQLTPEQVRRSSSFLIGSPAAIVDTLQERRERFGISYVLIHDRAMRDFAPVVARLAGT